MISVLQRWLDILRTDDEEFRKLQAQNNEICLQFFV